MCDIDPLYVWYRKASVCKPINWLSPGEMVELFNIRQAAIDAERDKVQAIEIERDRWKTLTNDWAEAAKRAEQHASFYEEYDEQAMNAMQALLTQARAQLAQRDGEEK